MALSRPPDLRSLETPASKQAEHGLGLYTLPVSSSAPGLALILPLKVDRSFCAGPSSAFTLLLWFTGNLS